MNSELIVDFCKRYRYTHESLVLMEIDVHIANAYRYTQRNHALETLQNVFMVANKSIDWRFLKYWARVANCIAYLGGPKSPITIPVEDGICVLVDTIVNVCDISCGEDFANGFLHLPIGKRWGFIKPIGLQVEDLPNAKQLEIFFSRLYKESQEEKLQKCLLMPYTFRESLQKLQLII